MEKGKPPVHFSSNIGEKISIVEIPAKIQNNDVFRDYTSTEEGEEESEEARVTLRELTSQVQIGNKFFEIKITRSLSEGKEIRDYMISVVMLFLIFSLALLFILNLVISKRIWSPFYSTMNLIKHWSIKDKTPITIEHSKIDEFNELNVCIHGLTKKIVEDYSNLKEFTENISHETQTPLAVISTKVELLMQESNYSESQKKLLSQAYVAIQRLKKLNETLITLTRIENNQFSEMQEIDLASAIKNIVAELHEFIVEKKIDIELELAPVKKILNPVVLSILLNNLFINSIKHNLDASGFIKIRLNQYGLVIQNSATTKEIDKKHLFERFKSFSTSPDSLGLGLSIIKKITDVLGWSLTYRYENNFHEFEIQWPSKSLN
jgi:signal transduction histidine kinase